MSDNQATGTALFLKPTKPVVLILLILFLLAGLGVRLIDLTDLPLDFAATRQLHSFIMARGYYYEMAPLKRLPCRRTSANSGSKQATANR